MAFRDTWTDRQRLYRRATVLVCALIWLNSFLPRELLVYAVEHGHTTLAVAMLRIGADPNAVYDPLFDIKHGENPMPVLHRATLSGNGEIVRALIEAGANIDARDLYSNGRTALSYALFKNDPDVLRALKRAGAKAL